MKRNELAAILQRAAVGAEYAFYAGSAHRMNGTVRIYPAAWLEPPVLIKSEGRREGGLTYRVALHFMALPSVGKSEQDLWSTLEEEALAVAKAAQQDDSVTEISNISCSPARESLTAHGEISVTLACDITLWYYS